MNTQNAKNLFQNLKQKKLSQLAEIMTIEIGDVSTLEDGAAVSEIQAAFEELKHSIQQNKSN